MLSFAYVCIFTGLDDLPSKDEDEKRPPSIRRTFSKETLGKCLRRGGANMGFSARIDDT